jgi:hypothetical protein
VRGVIKATVVKVHFAVERMSGFQVAPWDPRAALITLDVSFM